MATITPPAEVVRPDRAPPTTPGAVPPGRRARRPYLVSLPALLVTVGILVPFAMGVYYTFFNWSSGVAHPHFVGGHNYATIIPNQTFFSSVGVTVEYAVLTTAIETVLGTVVAILLNRSTILSRVLEKTLILPLMVAPIIAATIWSLMFNNTIGILDYVLGPFGFSHVQWTNSPAGALFSSVLVDIWVFTPFVALLVLAGLRSLPKDPFEAAAVDGATPLYTFRRLTLPMLWPYVLVAVIFRFMDGLKIFDIIYGLTAGGPGNATEALQLRAYDQAITYTNFSYGLTYMVILWAVVFIVVRGLVAVLGRAQRSAAGA